MSTDFFGEGVVIAVCQREDGGVPKYLQEQITIGKCGVEGDYHSGAISKRRGQEGRPNRRQVSILAKEVIDDLNSDLATEIPLGGLGENVVVAGLGDLSDVREGNMLSFSSGVVLEVTAQIDPCKDLMTYHDQLPKRTYGRRGVVSVVVSTGILKTGDAVSLTHRMNGEAASSPETDAAITACLFCKMARREIAVEKIYEDDLAFSVRDINPRAPVHLMVIPNQHIASVRDVAAQHATLLARMIKIADTMAVREGIADTGYRLALNEGKDSGQSVFHIHMHLLGGRRLGAEA